MMNAFVGGGRILQETHFRHSVDAKEGKLRFRPRSASAVWRAAALTIYLRKAANTPLQLLVSRRVRLAVLFSLEIVMVKAV